MGLFSKCNYPKSKCPDNEVTAAKEASWTRVLQRTYLNLLEASLSRERQLKSDNALKNEEISVLTLRLQEVTAHRDALLIDLDKYVQALLKRKRK